MARARARGACVCAGRRRSRAARLTWTSLPSPAYFPHPAVPGSTTSKVRPRCLWHRHRPQRFWPAGKLVSSACCCGVVLMVSPFAAAPSGGAGRGGGAGVRVPPPFCFSCIALVFIACPLCVLVRAAASSAVDDVVAGWLVWLAERSPRNWEGVGASGFVGLLRVRLPRCRWSASVP